MITTYCKTVIITPGIDLPSTLTRTQLHMPSKCCEPTMVPLLLSLVWLHGLTLSCFTSWNTNSRTTSPLILSTSISKQSSSKQVLTSTHHSPGHNFRCQPTQCTNHSTSPALCVFYFMEDKLYPLITSPLILSPTIPKQSSSNQVLTSTHSPPGHNMTCHPNVMYWPWISLALYCMGGSEKFWFYWRTKTYRAGVHCLYHACSKEDGGLAVGSAVKCRKAIFAYVAKRKSSSSTLYVCWNRVKQHFFFLFWKFGFTKIP